MNLPQLEHISIPLILAPMEGITDTVFRRICLMEGADAGISEFISSEAIIRNVEKSLRKMDAAKKDELRWIQIFGNNPESVAQAARVAEECGANIIDLNFGCPAKKVVSKGNGAALLRNLPLMQEIATEAVKAVNIPVTAKTRLGWDANSIVINEAASRLQDAGIKALTIHGRTRAQQYGGNANWDYIAEVKNMLSMPVIANGDINSPESAIKALQITNADGLMIGRAAIGNPWIFRQIRAVLNGNETHSINIKHKISVCRQHLYESIKLKGEHRAIVEMRKQYSQYFKGLYDFKHFKMELMAALSINEVNDIIGRIENKYA